MLIGLAEGSGPSDLTTKKTAATAESLGIQSVLSCVTLLCHSQVSLFSVSL